jgi:hypothetical protein
MATVWNITPKQSILSECDRRGQPACVRECVTILNGGPIDPEFLRVIGGPSASVVLDGRAGGLEGYWPRVWAARGLLHVWDDVATDAVIAATANDSWRVREMSAKVIARHHVAPAIDAVVALLGDDNARVRFAARRAFDAVAD